jgi:hypothetical protein
VLPKRNDLTTDLTDIALNANNNNLRKNVLIRERNLRVRLVALQALRSAPKSPERYQMPNLPSDSSGNRAVALHLLPRKMGSGKNLLPSILFRFGRSSPTVMPVIRPPIPSSTPAARPPPELGHRSSAEGRFVAAGPHPHGVGPPSARYHAAALPSARPAPFAAVEAHPCRRSALLSSCSIRGAEARFIAAGGRLAAQELDSMSQEVNLRHCIGCRRRSAVVAWSWEPVERHHQTGFLGGWSDREREHLERGAELSGAGLECYQTHPESNALFFSIYLNIVKKSPYMGSKSTHFLAC